MADSVKASQRENSRRAMPTRHMSILQPTTNIVPTTLIQNAPIQMFYNPNDHPLSHRAKLVIDNSPKKVKVSDKKDISPPPYRAPVMDPHQNSAQASRLALNSVHKPIEF